MIDRLRSEWAALCPHDRGELRMCAGLAALLLCSLPFAPVDEPGFARYPVLSVPVRPRTSPPPPVVGSIAELEAAVELFPEPSPGWRDRFAFWTFWDVFGSDPKLWRFPDFGRAGVGDTLSPDANAWAATAYRVAFRAHELDELLKQTTRFRLVVGYRAIGIVAHVDGRAAAGDPEWWFFRRAGDAAPLLPLDNLLSDVRLGLSSVTIGDLSALRGKRPDDESSIRRLDYWDGARERVSRALRTMLSSEKAAGTFSGYRFSTSRADAGEWAPPERVRGGVDYGADGELSNDELDAELEERRR